MKNNQSHNLIKNNSGIKVLIETGPKGSNPGGFCRYISPQGPISGYFKYCTGSKMPHSSHLIPEHQPVYEAITFELAHKLGLRTSNFFVLLNKNRDLTFERKDSSLNDPSGRPYYFFSEILFEPPQTPEVESVGNFLVNHQRPYLESLNISDIVGKRQNYVIPKRGDEFQIAYIDLGCSFVYATQGSIHLPNKFSQCLKNGNPKKEKCSLKSKTIIKADNKSFLDLEELVLNLDKLTIPTLNPSLRIPLSSLISKEEIKEINEYLVNGLCNSLHEYKDKGLLM